MLKAISFIKKSLIITICVKFQAIRYIVMKAASEPNKIHISYVLSIDVQNQVI